MPVYNISLTNFGFPRCIFERLFPDRPCEKATGVQNILSTLHLYSLLLGPEARFRFVSAETTLLGHPNSTLGWP